MTIQKHLSPYEKLYFIIVSLLLVCPLIRGQPSPPEPPHLAGQQNFSPSMGVIIIVLIAALFFMGFFSIYIRHCTEVTPSDSTRRRILTGALARSRRAPRGLDPAVIESFPTFDYAAVKSAKIGKGALECAVCITEFEDDDLLRLIPKCDHVFHPECIDQWLTGHVTCPVCRANLSEPVSLTEVNFQNETVLDVIEDTDVNSSNSNSNNIDENHESMEAPLNGRLRRSRSMIRNISFGRPRWMGKFSRSLSTGHVAVKQWENMDRFTLRLPNDIRKQIMNGKLERSTSLLVLPRETSTRRGFRAGFGEGTSRGPSRSVVEESDHRWVFSLAPPFITRGPSVRSPKDMAVGAGVTRDGSVRSSVRFPKDMTVGTVVSRDGSVRSSVKSPKDITLGTVVTRDGSVRSSMRSPKDITLGTIVTRDGSVRSSMRSPKDITLGKVVTRDGSVRSSIGSPKDVTVGTTMARDGSVRRSVQGDITQLPV